MITRRRFLGSTAMAGMGLVLPWSWTRRGVAEVPLLDPATQDKFVNPLPRPARIDATRGGRLNVAMRETTQFLGLVDPQTRRRLQTAVWGYRFSGHPTYPGATIVAQRDRRLDVQWQNQLQEEREPWAAHLLPVDTSIHIAMPERLPKSGVPLVTHLHGGHTESASDGLPEAWFTKNFKETGPHYVKRVYRYDNSQEAATLWYHDHTLGITRLNVYAGLAGFYLLRDDNENRLIADGVLPGGGYEVELAIQDRMFSADGQLFLPADPPPPNELECFDENGQSTECVLPTPDPSIVAEFFGNFILVNGVIWPKLAVESRKYRLRLLNGSDSRFYVLELRDAQQGGTRRSFLQIGTDGGLLEFPVELDRLVLAPGERADLIVDFAGLGASTPIYLRNFGPDEPFTGVDEGEPADPQTTGQVMRFDVTLPLAGGFDATVDPGTRLRDPIEWPADPRDPNLARRELVLFEGRDQFGRLRPQLGTLEDGSLLWDEEPTENPGLGDVELWEVYNATADAHPIHLHLVQFLILNRQDFDGEAEIVGLDEIEGGTKQFLFDPELSGAPEPPADNEAGWKDTVIMPPGRVTRIIAQFDRPGRYVWHCHILSHEDHEMMRPYYVGPITA